MEEMMYDMTTMRDVCIFREDRVVRDNSFNYAYYLQSDGADITTIIKDWTEQVIINSFLSHTRKAWMIQSGAGSQSSDWDAYKILNKIVDAICDKHINWEEDDEE